MYGKSNESHRKPFPNARQIRRSCNKELYRTIKKLKMWIPPEELEKAETLYFKKVLLHLPWIVENGSNRKLLADWWDEHVCPEVAELWNLEPAELSRAFRDSFGG